MLALSADACAVQQLANAVRRPLATGDRRHVAIVEVGGDGAEAVPGEESLGHLLDHRRLSRNHDEPVLGIAVRARSATTHLPRLGELEVLADQTAALVVALLAGHSSEDTGMEAAVMGAEVDLAGDAGQGTDAGAIAEVEKVFQFARAAVKAVEVIHDDRVPGSGSEVIKQARVLRTPLARVGAGVVVDVDVCHAPAAALGERAAVLDLSGDTCGQAVRVGGDPGIDCRGLRSHQGTLAYPRAHEHAVTRPTPTKSLRRPTVALVSGVLNDKREER